MATRGTQERHRKTKFIILTGPRETKSMHVKRRTHGGSTKKCAQPSRWGTERGRGRKGRRREEEGIGREGVYWGSGYSTQGKGIGGFHWCI